jgi:hypothetical protein
MHEHAEQFADSSPMLRALDDLVLCVAEPKGDVVEPDEDVLGLEAPSAPNNVGLSRLREALQAGWGVDTAYMRAEERGNPALGNCYPTSRVLQILCPQAEIVEGVVWTGNTSEKHFWNLLSVDGVDYHIDLTWQQFPQGSVVTEWTVRNRATLGDSEATAQRVKTLFERVEAHLRDHV